MSTYQDNSQPLIFNLDFLIYTVIAKHIFDPQWRFLAALKGIDRTSHDVGLMAYKERQIFIQLLRCWAARRMASRARGRLIKKCGDRKTKFVSVVDLCVKWHS